MRRKGFTLIELLIVVAIIGIIAAIAIPNLLNAVQRAKQKRTMADIRSAATAWEAYAVDNNCYSAQCGGTCDMLGTDASADVFSMLSPTYIKSLPTRDGWGTAMVFANEAGSNAQEYGIQSYGKDLASQGTAFDCGTKTTNFKCDIVYMNGGFVQWPEGLQN